MKSKLPGKSMRFPSAAGALGIALLGLAACGGGQPTSLPAEGEPLTLTDGVRQTMSTLLRNYKPPSPQVEIAFSTVDQMPSTTVTANVLQTYQMQDSRLWAVTSRGTNSFTGGGSSDGLSLCGLVTLLTVGHGKAVSTVPTLVPVGPVFMPFSIRTTRDSTIRRRVTNLQTDAAEICNPTPGSRFSYTVDLESAFRTSGLFGVDASGLVSYRDTCEVGSARPAREIAPGLNGSGLLVTCNRVVSKTGQQSVQRFLFLPDFALFLDIGNQSKDNTHGVTYTSVTAAR
jgi:hypothetical protein